MWELWMLGRVGTRLLMPSLELQERQGCLGRQKYLGSQTLPSSGEPTNSSSLLQMYVACMGGWECGRLFDAFFRAAGKAEMLGESELTLLWGI